jgi:hypothetical protein
MLNPRPHGLRSKAPKIRTTVVVHNDGTIPVKSLIIGRLILVIVRISYQRGVGRCRAAVRIGAELVGG